MYLQRTAFLRKADPYLTPTQNRFGRVRLVSLTIRFGVKVRKARRRAGLLSDPTGIRTRVFAVRGRCPWPLDDGAALPEAGKVYPTVSASSKRANAISDLI